MRAAMNVSQKCQYAIRSILELGKRYGQGPTSISEIASKQVIPPRFLEIILNELRQGGFVDSRRGVQGGYMLRHQPRDLTVGQIIRFVDGPLEPVKCIGSKGKEQCGLRNQCALIHLWTRAKEAVEGVYDTTTFGDLVEQERELEQANVLDYSI